jgi:biopolymer transport protein ExbD
MGRKNTNANLNLTPYVDLLSTLICFLLLTAVWQQISVISTASSVSNVGSQNSVTNASSNLNAGTTQEGKMLFLVSIYKDRIETQAGAEAIERIQHHYVSAGLAQPDYQSLKKILKQWKTRFPDRKDVVLNTDDESPYKFLIGTMDTLMDSDFSDVGINTK